jgi:hypothetical protein
MATIIGGSLTAGWVEQPESGPQSKVEEGDEFTRIFVGVSTLTMGSTIFIGTSTLATGITFGAADIVNTQCFLRGVEFEPMESNDFRKMTLKFKPAQAVDFLAPSPPTGTVTLSADANLIDEPISNHPTLTEQQKADLIAAGVESYAIPQPVFSREQVLNTFLFSEANVISNVGKINLPTSMTSPTTNKWLKMSLVVQQTGVKFVKRESWQYSDTGWNTYIYGTQV